MLLGAVYAFFYASILGSSLLSFLGQTATPVPPVIDSVADVVGGTTSALTSVISLTVFGILGVSGFVLMLARRFGPGLIKALK